MSAKSRTQLLVVTCVLSSLLLLNVSCFILNDPFEGTWVYVNPDTGAKETWSIEQNESQLSITVKRENNGMCEILTFDANAPQDQENVGDATGTFEGSSISFSVSFNTIRVDQTETRPQMTFNFVDASPTELSCTQESSGEFSGTWSFSGNDSEFESIWSIVQTDEQLMITRRNKFAVDGACIINTFEATVDPNDPKRATGEAFNLALSLVIDASGNLVAVSGEGAPETYNQTNSEPTALPCPEQS